MQKGFAPVLILVGILIVAAVAGGAYYIGKSATLKLQPQNPAVTSQTLQPTITPKLSPISNETVNWKTYTNTTYDYLIQFPDDYEVPSQTERQKGQLGIDNNMCVKLKKDNQCSLVMDYWAKSLEETVKIKSPTDGTQPQDYVVGSIKGKRFVYKIGESTTQAIVLIPKPNTINATMVLSYIVAPGNIEGPKIIEQILSTFKFTN